jgi:mRNA-degrading endonuclease toxin of MazEF toxin-antitoxin module
MLLRIVKRFLEWIQLKERLHQSAHKPPLFRQGEIWWCSIGENVGSEINGKSKLFSRPVLVFKKLSSTTFLGIPTSSQDRNGSWYVHITLQDKTSVVILSQIRVFDYKRLSSKIGHLDAYDYKQVRLAFKKLFLNEK